VNDDCPCGTGRTYDDCCGRLHRRAAQASTAEQLMRSRYSAFALGDAAYLARSWASATRPDRIALAPDQRWVRLEVLSTTDGGVLARDGMVEFRADFERSGRVGSLHERSRFEREDGRWVYVGPDDALVEGT
jgi:SEC-C motif-containing protein